MTPRFRDLLLLTTAVFVLLLAACGEKAPDTARTEPPGASAGTPSAAGGEIPGKFTLRGQGKEAVAVFKLSGDRPQIVVRGEKTRTFVRRAPGKGVQWVERGQGAAFLVRGNGEKGFTLHDAGGKPLWKMRFGNRRILAFSGSGEEAGKPAFTLRRQRENVVRTLGGSGEVLGSAVLSKTGRLRVSDASGELLYKSREVPPSAMFGVLPVVEADFAQRCVLMAEILLRQGGHPLRSGSGS